MPKTKRDNLKRKWSQAKVHLEEAAIDIMELQAEFNPTHPEYVELADYVLQTIAIAMDGWDSFCLHAWGKLPKHSTDWR